VWPLVNGDGSLLVSDDVGGVIWRVSNPNAPAPVAAAKPAPAAK
jgi:hypothetical protein